jgi:hypothetical protein
MTIEDWRIAKINTTDTKDALGADWINEEPLISMTEYMTTTILMYLSRYPIRTSLHKYFEYQEDIEGIRQWVMNFYDWIGKQRMHKEWIKFSKDGEPDRMLSLGEVIGRFKITLFSLYFRDAKKLRSFKFPWQRQWTKIDLDKMKLVVDFMLRDCLKWQDERLKLPGGIVLCQLKSPNPE